MVAKEEDTKVELVKLNDLDLSCQTRAELDTEAVNDFAAALKAGDTLPPGIAVRLPTGRLLLAAGYHRHKAHEMAGLKAMPVVIREGGRFDALRIGIQDNADQKAVRLTREDRKEAATKILRERPVLSDRAIAGMVGLSHTSINSLRTKLSATVKTLQSDVRIGRDGREIHTTNIGKRAEEREQRTNVEVDSLTGLPLVRTEEEIAAVLRTASSNLQATVANLTAEDVAVWRRNFRHQVQGGAHPEAAGWGAISETERATGHKIKRITLPSSEAPERPSASRPTKEDARAMQEPASPQNKPGEATGAGGVKPSHRASEQAGRVPDADVVQMFKGFFERLGRTKRVLDDLSLARPGWQYERAMKSLDEASDVVTAWAREEGLGSEVAKR